MEPKFKEGPLYDRQLDWDQERLDSYQFQIGELVKVFNIISNTWRYGYVVEDNRRLSYCSYTYCIAPVIDEPAIDGGYVVYGCEPRYMEPCTSTEEILYGSKNNFFKNLKRV